MIELLLIALLSAPSVSVRDTVFQLREGDEIVLQEFSGELEVVGWGEDYLAAETGSDRTAGFEFNREGNRVTLKVFDEKGRNRGEDLRLRVPEWAKLDLSGRGLEATVRGLVGSVKIRTLRGDVILEELRGSVDVVTTSGEIDARGLHGPASLRGGSDQITVRGSSGRMEIETVSGDIELTDVISPSVSARTTSGEVDFSGALRPGGDYAFRTHSGELTLVLRDPVDVDVSVVAYEGEFSSEFPIRARGFRSGEEMTFTLGQGGSRLILEAFGGEITLRRGGS